MPFFHPERPAVAPGQHVLDQRVHHGVISCVDGDTVLVRWDDGTGDVSDFKVADLDPDYNVWRVERSWPWRAGKRGPASVPTWRR